MKQGLAQDYTQRIEEGNIVRQKLSRLKLYRLRLHRHRLGWARGHGLRLYSLSLYGSETGGGGGGSSEIIYSSPSIRKKTYLYRLCRKNYMEVYADMGKLNDSRGGSGAHQSHRSIFPRGGQGHYFL